MPEENVAGTLTEEQINLIKSNKKSYIEYGFGPNLHKEIIMPAFKDNDEQSVLIENVSGGALQSSSIPLDKLNPQELIKLSGVAELAAFSVANGGAFAITMTLTLKFDGYTIAVPRWTLYEQETDGSYTELVDISNDYREFNVVRTWQKTRGLGGSANLKHILHVATANVSGAAKTLQFRGDWLYIGNLVKSS